MRSIRDVGDRTIGYERGLRQMDLETVQLALSLNESIDRVGV